jgi:hypothetical protein
MLAFDSGLISFLLAALIFRKNPQAVKDTLD